MLLQQLGGQILLNHQWSRRRNSDRCWNTRLDTGKLVGDVDYENVISKCSMIIPVPGGVGPMTITMLLWNTLESFKNQLLDCLTI